MSLTSLLAALQPDTDNAAVIGAAASLAARFGAHIDGLVLAPPLRISPSEAYLASDLAAEDRTLRMDQMQRVETAFRAGMEGQAPTIGWHADLHAGDIAAAIGDHARSSDLILAASEPPRGFTAPPAAFRLGDLVMQAGRPVLVLPTSPDRALTLTHALVAWKDGVPARRALADSLPLLHKCRRVTLVELVPEAELPEAERRLRLIAGWLARHGITAAQHAAASVGEDARRLQQIAKEESADLLVAGAYAHSRAQEWLFGGVTRRLLTHPEIPTLLSH
ncbi:universal stress protein [Acidisoma sp. 7E03]